jgi:hypothetical protein
VPHNRAGHRRASDLQPLHLRSQVSNSGTGLFALRRQLRLYHEAHRRAGGPVGVRVSRNFVLHAQGASPCCTNPNMNGAAATPTCSSPAWLLAAAAASSAAATRAVAASSAACGVLEASPELTRW